MMSGAAPDGARIQPNLTIAALVLAWWVLLAVCVAFAPPTLTELWPAWPWAASAAAVWGVNFLLLAYAIGPPFRVSRPPILATGFALLMTLFGSGSYWATVQLYPAYRVGIERAAWFVAICTAVTLGGCAALTAALCRIGDQRAVHFEWDWSRLGAATYIVFVAAAVGTAITVGRIGYVPILAGDPGSARVDFPEIGGVWYRLSMLGGVSALLVAVQVAARRATLSQYVVGVASLLLVGLYGPRFFVALPLGVALLLWDRVRSRIRLRHALWLVVVVAPLMALVGYWRERAQSVALLSPLGLLVYGTLGEFRDLGWALDYYSLGDRFLHGRTIGSLVVPLLPGPVWQLVGVDKAAIYAQNSATVLADVMGQTTGQRIGAYGELFMNFGWTGALLGSALYGTLLSYLDDRYGQVSAGEVRGVFLAVTIAVAVFAQVGQLNMFTSTLTGFAYPIGIVVLLAACRRIPSGARTP
jgi:hypothetical protein